MTLWYEIKLRFSKKFRQEAAKNFMTIRQAGIPSLSGHKILYSPEMPLWMKFLNFIGLRYYLKTEETTVGVCGGRNLEITHYECQRTKKNVFITTCVDLQLKQEDYDKLQKLAFEECTGHHYRLSEPISGPQELLKKEIYHYYDDVNIIDADLFDKNLKIMAQPSVDLEILKNTWSDKCGNK
jgi:hypothetical protein